MPKRNIWTLEKLDKGLKTFVGEYGRYPTSDEVDTFPHLPSSRSIQRRFGGLVSLRKQLGISEEHDLRQGMYSSQRAIKINKRSHKTEAIVYKYLVEKFGKHFVHREYFFTDDKRTRADFFVYDNKTNFCVDVFFPSTKRNLTGCLNSKLDKYRSVQMNQYPVIFLQMNEGFSQIDLDKLIKRKEKPLQQDQYLMSLDTFKEFCNERGCINIKG